MKRRIVGAIVLALLQGGIVASLAVQYRWDREHLPRAWVRARPDAVQHPVNGRYLRVPLAPITDAPITPSWRTLNERVVFDPAPVTLEARDGRLRAWKAAASRVNFVHPRNRKDEPVVLWPPVELFVPPSAGDPHWLLEGELWLEVSVPRQGAPRALRAGRMKDGRIEPITF